jgi:hypothetical protein
VLNLLTWQCSNTDLWYYFEGVPYALDCTSIIGFPQMFDVVPRITVRNNHPFYGSSAFSVQSAASPAALNENLFRCCIFPTNCQLGTSDGPGTTIFADAEPLQRRASALALVAHELGEALSDHLQRE